MGSMRATDLDLRELLDFEPSGGIIRFAGQRALVFDAVALGLLRRELIDRVGVTVARGILTRFGYAHGWRMAEMLRDQFPWESEHEWRIAGGRLHKLTGHLLFEPTERTGEDAPFASADWHESYEAEQHLLHIGRADECVCWTLCGFASGYLSCANGKTIYCEEVKCRGKGDAICTMVGQPREKFSEACQKALSFYEETCVDGALGRITNELKATEKKLRKAKRETKSDVDGDTGSVVVKSEAMRQVVDLARRIAQVDSTALVTGESGVGKEVLARFIHDSSARASRPFVAINCGAVPEGLLESELFGHARGSFTGATGDRPGLFEAATGGTLFLDEIGDVPPSMQVKLLRALQEREVRRVGENKNRSVDVRVVAATNRDLTADVASGRFRQDLYYRLRVIELRVPPLRQRKDDVLPLARAFLASVSARMRRKVTGFTPQAANQLVRYAWPGNVRELENAVERAVALARGTRVDVEDLPEEVSAALPSAEASALGTNGAPLPLDAMEREYILAVLKASGGNKAHAARQLKIGTATLFRKLKEYEERGLA